MLFSFNTSLTFLVIQALPKLPDDFRRALNEFECIAAYHCDVLGPFLGGAVLSRILELSGQDAVMSSEELERWLMALEYPSSSEAQMELLHKWARNPEAGAFPETALLLLLPPSNSDVDVPLREVPPISVLEANDTRTMSSAEVEEAEVDEVVETSAVPTAASSHSKRPSRADEHISTMRAQVSKPPVVSQGKKRACPVDEDDEDGADYKADENQMEVDEDSPPEESDVVRSIPGVPDWLY